MKIVIFGATGGVGRALVEQTLAAHHEVTTFQRKTSNAVTEQMRFVQGDMRDLSSVESAVKGQDVVLSAIGARRVKEADIYPQGTANIIAAMEKYQVRRLIAITSAAVDNDPELGFVFGKIIKPLFLKDIYVGMKQLEKNVLQSDLDWTIVGPGWLTDGPHTGVYRISDSGMPKGSRNISRADVADLMLKESTNTQHIHKKLVIVY